MAALACERSLSYFWLCMVCREGAGVRPVRPYPPPTDCGGPLFLLTSDLGGLSSADHQRIIRIFNFSSVFVLFCGLCAKIIHFEV